MSKDHPMIRMIISPPSWGSRNNKTCLPHDYFLLSLLVNPEDGSDTVLRTIGGVIIQKIELHKWLCYRPKRRIRFYVDLPLLTVRGRHLLLAAVEKLKANLSFCLVNEVPRHDKLRESTSKATVFFTSTLYEANDQLYASAALTHEGVPDIHRRAGLVGRGTHSGRNCSRETFFAPAENQAPAVQSFDDWATLTYNNTKRTPWPLGRKQTIPTDRPPLVDEI
jgi:hypothetical protein